MWPVKNFTVSECKRNTGPTFPFFPFTYASADSSNAMIFPLKTFFSYFLTNHQLTSYSHIGKILYYSSLQTTTRICIFGSLRQILSVTFLETSSLGIPVVVPKRPSLLWYFFNPCKNLNLPISCKDTYYLELLLIGKSSPLISV